MGLDIAVISESGQARVMDMFSHLQWREPLWLWIALCPWCLWLLQVLLRPAQGKDYADPQLMPWARAQSPSSLWARFEMRRYWRHVVLALAWLLFAMAMAGPRLAKTIYDVNKDHYTELMVVFDMSRSMAARDISPSRLERAKLELEDFIAREDRLKIGLVVYAARPHLLAPPTADKSVLRHDVSLLRYGLLPTAGSNLSAAIAFAAKHFTSNKSAHALLLVTDGGLSTETAASDKQIDETVTRLAQQGIKLYALGVGTTGGAPLQGAEGSWLRYHHKPVVSRLHEDRLKHLAELGNGRYASVSDSDAEWRTLYDQGIHYLNAADVNRNGNSLIEWHELYAWCLLPAIVLFLLVYLEPKPVAAASLFPLLFAMCVIAGSLHPTRAYAATQSWQQRAYQAYHKKSYLEAKQDYARVAGYPGRMGEGSSAYRLGQYHEAIRLFTQAVLDADNDKQRARAVFNLANSHYRLKEYGAAVALYRQALLYKPHDGAAQSNLAFAIAMQKQQQQNDETERRGPGHGSGRPANTGNAGNGRLTIDNKETRLPALPLLPQTQSPKNSDIIERGIYDSQPVIAQATEFKDPDWQYQTTSSQRIELQASELKFDPGALWKRIFEGEEGFPAPVKTPQHVPGVLPW